MRTLIALLFVMAGCVVEEDPLPGAAGDVLSDEAWALPLDEAGPPIVAASVEMAFGQLSPGVFFNGTIERVEAPVVRGRPVPARARCAWQFDATAVLPSPTQPPNTTWAFRVEYRPSVDLVLQRTGVPSVCSGAVFPAGVGAAFTEAYALDSNLNQILHLTPGGWVPYAANHAPAPAGLRPTTFDWFHVLQTWP